MDIKKFAECDVIPAEHAEKAHCLLMAMRGIFGLSQSDLAELSGVSRQTISRFENRSDIEIQPGTLVCLLRVAAHLGILMLEADDGLSLHITQDAVHRAIRSAGKKDQDPLDVLSDLKFIAARIKEGIGRDATPKKYQACRAKIMQLSAELSTDLPSSK